MKLAEKTNLYFQSIESLSFKARLVREKLVEPDLYGASSSKGGIIDITLQGRQYKIDDQSSMATSNHNLVAFDGETYKRYTPDRSRLYVEKIDLNEQRPSEYFFRYSNPLLLPFEFVAASTLTDDTQALDFSAFKDGAFTESFMRRVIAIQKSEDASEVIMFVEAGLEWISGRKSHFRVTFDAEHQFYPVEVLRMDENDKLIYRYKVTKLSRIEDGNGTAIVIPVSATREYFGAGEMSENLVPDGIITFDITEVELNQKLDDDFFDIDPTVADIIYDGDEELEIVVPK